MIWWPIIALLALMFSSTAWAVPSISGSSGTYSHGNTITITGNGFGSKSPAKPLIWATFEGGSCAADASLSTTTLSECTYQADTGNQAHALSSYNVSNIARPGTGLDKDAAFVSVAVNTGTYYVFSRRYWPPTTFQEASNLKVFWAWPTLPGCTSNPEPYVNTIFDYLNFRMSYALQGTGAVLTDYIVPPGGEWLVWEIADKKGTANNYDGVLKWWQNGVLVANWDVMNVTTAYPTDTYCKLVNFDFWTQTEPGYIYPSWQKDYIDDVYMDATWARVMIGNASTFSASTHREPLIPTAWSDTAITAYFNQGSFGNGQSVYIFVVDSDGNASPGRLITISGTQQDGSPPYATNYSPAKSSTGVLATNRTISFTLNDATDVLTANGIVEIEGTQYTCGSGITCTGNGTPTVNVSYVKGSDWSFDQVVNVSISGFRDSIGNIMTTDTYSYTIQSDPNPSLNITTTTLPNGTVSTSYSQSISATGGTSPYVWSVQSGTLPTGLSLTSAGLLSGTPTEQGTFNWVALVTDNVSATDNQSLSVLINPATPGGGGTLTITGFQDSFTNIGQETTNYSSETYVEVYQWPANTTANRVVDNVSLSSLPANSTITNATLRMYMLQTDPPGAGGDATMRIYVYPVTGMPSISTVTWTTFDANATMGSYESYADVGKTPGWATWNVTNAAQAAKAGSVNLFLALDGAGGGSLDTSRQFASSDYTVDTSLRPQLVVTYTVGTPTISAPGKMRVNMLRGSFR